MKILLVLSILFWSQASIAKKKILIVGDSLTEGYGVAKDSAYPNQLQILIDKNKMDYQVINAGSSGSTSASAPNRLKWHMKSKPEILILALGANDGLRGFEVSSTKENLGKAIDMALKNNVKVYLAGMKLPMNYGKKYRAQFESIFTELQKEKKIKLIPFLLKDVGGVKDLNLADGIHPNEKGHKIIAKTVYQFIKKDL